MRISDWSSDVCSSDLRSNSQKQSLLEVIAGGSEDYSVVSQLLERGAPADFGDKYVVVEAFRSEEHTSELQSLMRISYAVFCLKKKTKKQETTEHDVH